MSILSVDLISPIGSGTTITLNATEVKTGNEITVGTGASIFSPAGNTLILGTNNVERIRIKNDGKVGIGSDNPQDILDVASAVPQIRLSDTSDGSYGQVRANGGNLIIRADEGNTIADSVILAEIDGDEKVRITSNGRIGIGDINPTRDVVLKTSGSVQFSMVGATNQSVYLNFGDTDDDNIGAVYYDNPNDRMIIRANTNNAVQVKSNGNMAINDGDLEIGTSGHGISFAATSDGSGMTSELLDDYEEGYFQPTFDAPNQSSTGFVIFHNHGYYTKVGNIVNVTVYIQGYASSNASGGSNDDIKIIGLPFAPAVLPGSGSSNRHVANWTFGTTYKVEVDRLEGYTYGGNTYIDLLVPSNGGTGTMLKSNQINQNTNQFWCTATYRV